MVWLSHVKRAREQAGDRGSRGTREFGGCAEPLLCITATSVWHGLKSWGHSCVLVAFSQSRLEGQRVLEGKAV